MQAIEIIKPGGPEVLTLCERAKPEPQAGEVLIKVKAAGVNRPDCVQRMGLYPAPPGITDIPGLEVAGTVDAVGEGVTAFNVGDAVCALVAGGGYAEYCTAPIETVLPIPAGFSFEAAAALPENYYTVWSNVIDRAKLANHETILVHGGSSGIGSTAIQLAKLVGASVITTAGTDEKIDFCKQLGADLAINYKTSDFVEEVRTFAMGGVDVVLDMVGGDYIDKNISCMAIGGRHISIAFLSGPNVQMNMLPVMLKRLVLTGSTLRPRDNDFKGAIAGQLLKNVWPALESKKIAPVIDTVLPLKDAAKAHALMEASTHMGKIILSVE